MKLKLYIWEDVLTDYTSGLVCVLARSEKQAWEKLHEKDSTACWVLLGEPEDRASLKITSKAIRPRIITEPEAFTVWGGG